jgi:hypothetical protein
MEMGELCCTCVVCEGCKAINSNNAIERIEIVKRLINMGEWSTKDVDLLISSFEQNIEFKWFHLADK